MEIYGNIHSIESCGTVDGPGIRFVVFTQGCPMRCQYCHNPDTWDCSENKKMSVDEILTQYEGVKEFVQSGGITVTGGEPLLQLSFVKELFKSAKEKSIHTALDTSGILYTEANAQRIDTLLRYTDLVLLDIKHIDDDEHKKLTGHSNKNVLAFAQHLSEKGVPVWIRHVVVPGITDNEIHLKKLGEFIATLKNLAALDILPYHSMAESKYKELNLPYPLKGTPQTTKEQAIKARGIILDGYKNAINKFKNQK